MRKYAFPKFAATSIFVSSVLFSCDKEENQLLDPVQNAEASNVIVEQVDFNAIPELSKALTESSGKSVLPSSYSGKEGSSFWIDESDVLKLKDSVENESYSIVIHSDDPSPTKLYNLVVTKRTEGDPIAPFVVEYNFEGGDMSSFAEDYEKHFEGTLNIYALNEFAKITGLNAKDDDPVICFRDVGVRDNVPADNSTPSPPGNPGGGSPSAEPRNPSRPSAIVTRTHISVNNNFRSTGVSVGIGTFYMSRPMMTNEDQDQKAHITGKKIPNDCPEGWVSIPINEVKEDLPPSCKSFKFSQDSNGLTQTAAVKNVSFRVRFVDPATGKTKTSDVVFRQPIYFSTPRFHSEYGNLTTGEGANRAAKALLSAHSRATAYFLATEATESQVRARLWEYIRDEMRNGAYMSGGSASFTPPLGGFQGTVNQYQTTVFFLDDCK